MARRGLKAVVVGGGIGGLAAGLAMRRAGIEVRVLEARPQLGEIGAGLSLWPIVPWRGWGWRSRSPTAAPRSGTT
ncbi:NAD(P)-binding protein [Candidatus Nephthysia bennettiae]|uniref:NAD(P)-binding protein n=1 Tax=Candidatus Nephthysia bennettiae TaxID=3127016 RepID=A0A934JZA7_9BACT|nr:NAD(P)-binding protein [Candidatus Dormibacteraeota bacterium]MBJ7613253.1 NAD(P)-binding protein [Candidatus Dormibacteraeota bacterium]